MVKGRDEVGVCEHCTFVVADGGNRLEHDNAVRAESDAIVAFGL
jgi:hypothetical protein